MKLYELAGEYENILENICDPDTGEINEKAMQELDTIKDSIEKKSIAVVKFFKGLDAEAEAIAKEKKAMAARESHFKKQVASLKEYLLLNMKRSGINKISCPEFIINLRENRASVDGYNTMEIPTKYKSFEVKIHKDALLRDLKAGHIIPGARLKYDPYLEIR